MTTTRTTIRPRLAPAVVGPIDPLANSRTIQTPPWRRLALNEVERRPDVTAQRHAFSVSAAPKV